MGIVLKQSFKNTVITFAAFGIGGVNALFLYTNFLSDEYYGLVTYLLSTANLLMPLTAFGVQYAIVKFYSSYTDTIQRDRFLSFSLLLPFFIALPFGFIGAWFYEQIGAYLSEENPIIKDYTFIIYLVAITTAYFEIFYAWARVQLKSVFGNLMREMFTRIVVSILLVLVALKVIDQVAFIYFLTASYFLRTIIMMVYAFVLYLPKFSFSLPNNYKEVLKYSAYIILAGSAGAILLDIDKFMIPQKEALQLAAFYAVGVYIASVIEAPGRAMAQIVQPLTSKALNENDFPTVSRLYKSTSINLLLICGLFFLLINLNVSQLYLLIKPEYAKGVSVVLMISIAKLYTMALGNNGAIISNSKHYKILLPYSLAMAISVVLLNYWLIDLLGMNGAALSTLIVILFFNSLKLWYVKKTFGLNPFTRQTVYLLFIIIVIYGLFSFWDFPFHPILNILLKSSIIVFLYFFVVKKGAISADINALFTKYL